MWTNISTYLANNISAEQLEAWLGKALLIVVILIVLRVAIHLSELIIERTFQVRFRKEEERGRTDHRRADTLKKLLKSVVRYVFFFLAAITILDGLGVPIMAVLSAAGILGLAVGFGAQNLVKDIITGFFILFEDQFSVGEYIEIQGIGGVVEEVGLRITKLRDWGGQLHIIPNGSIGLVANYHRGSLRALVEVGVSYQENLDRVLQVLEKVCQGIRNDFPAILTMGPKVIGVTEMDQSKVVVRITAETVPMEQWGIERELRKRIKEAFEQEGIKRPYTQEVIIKKDEA